MKAKFLRGATGTVCELAKLSQISPGSEFEVTKLTEARNGSWIIDMVDPTNTFVGGDDGKTTLPCNLRVQVPKDAVEVK